MFGVFNENVWGSLMKMFGVFDENLYFFIMCIGDPKISQLKKMGSYESLGVSNEITFGSLI